jgi:hypothetical protein
MRRSLNRHHGLNRFAMINAIANRRCDSAAFFREESFDGDEIL